MLGKPVSEPLDVYKAFLEERLHQAIEFYTSSKGLLTSFKILGRTKPKQLEFVDIGSYDRCGVWDARPCSCSVYSDIIAADKHYAGKPKFTDVALRIPVSSLREWLYNRGRLLCWKWSLRIMTDTQFLEEAKKRPEIYYDMFVYPVNTEYLTPETTKAAVYRWLKISCPKLNYNIALISKDQSCLPRRT